MGEHREKILERLNEDGMLVLKEDEGCFSSPYSMNKEEDNENQEEETNTTKKGPLKELRFRLPTEEELDTEATKYCERVETSENSNGYNNRKNNFKGRQFGGKNKGGKFYPKGKR